jgi:hypothetical protein
MVMPIQSLGPESISGPIFVASIPVGMERYGIDAKLFGRLPAEAGEKFE